MTFCEFLVSEVNHEREIHDTPFRDNHRTISSYYDQYIDHIVFDDSYHKNSQGEHK